MRIVLLVVALASLLPAQQDSGELEARRQAVRQNPRDAESFARLGVAYQNAGQPHEAAEALENALRLNPALPRVPVLLAFVYMQTARYRDAAPLLQSAWEKEPAAEMRSLVGQRLVECLFATGAEEQALGVITELRRLRPDDPDVLYLSAKAYANLWNSTVQRLLDKSADSWRARQILAEVLETQEKFSEAAAEYRTIVRLQPALPQFHYRLGRMLLRADSSEEGARAALTEFREELRINPFDVPSRIEIADLELKAGNVDAAVGMSSRAVALQPANPSAQLTLARARIAARQFEAALEPLEQARRLAPQDETVLYQQMLALRSLGRTADAREAQMQFQRLKAEKERKVSGIRERLKTGTPMAAPTQP